MSVQIESFFIMDFEKDIEIRKELEDKADIKAAQEALKEGDFLSLEAFEKKP